MFVANRSTFSGVFPRKGQKMARFDTPRQGRVWRPIKSGPVVLADVVSGGQGYIEGSALTPESLAKIPEWDRHLVYLSRYPGVAVQLAQDWTTEDWSLSGTTRRVIPAGSWVMYADQSFYETGWYAWSAA